MKKTALIVLIIAAFAVMNAAAVTEQQAQAVALTHLAVEQQSAYQIVETTAVYSERGTADAWVYDLQPQGFIIVTSDTDLVPVYAYSFRNEFSLAETERNTGLMLLKEDLRLRKEARYLRDAAVIESNNSKWQAYLQGDIAALTMRDRSVYPPSSYNTPTGGWVVTQWDQGYPYNQYCPQDPDAGGRSVVGCVATAFAQVVNYHREIGELSFDDSDDYLSDDYTSPVAIDDDYETYNFLSFPELNPLIDDIRDIYANGLNFSSEAKGALSFACGILTEMQYSNSGSGTQTLYAGYAFSERLGYDSVLNIYNITDDFYNTLSDDMVNGRPAMLSILGGPEGHAIVCDGWNDGTDYYHLNMGWSGIDDGWYSLPEGMPSGYNVIHEAICNIEGGTVPGDIIGYVSAVGVPTAGTVITLDGALDYICEVDETGMFNLAFVDEGYYTVTATLALPEGGYYYHQQEEYIDSSNSFLEIYLDNYEFIDGQVTGPVDPAGAGLCVYQDSELLSETTIDADGSYEMPGLLPGSYVLVASKAPSYGRIRHIEVDLETQTFDFELFDYQQSSEISYAGEAESVWSLIATTMSVAVKLTEDELGGMEQALISGVKFKAPLGIADGALWAQVWQDEMLISEVPVESFEYGEELEIDLDNFAMVQSGHNYYVGYKVQSGNTDIAWHDAGPRVAGKGAWFRINSWTELPETNDVNFCIEATVLHPMLDGDTGEIVQGSSLLKQNYPNPFNPETTISFELADQQAVNLAVYNIKGEKVMELADEILTAGDHYYQWSGNDGSGRPVASGIYFYKLTTKDHSESRKMILLK